MSKACLLIKPRLESDLVQRQPAAAQRPDQPKMCATPLDFPVDHAHHEMAPSWIVSFLQGPSVQTLLTSIESNRH